MTDSDSEPSPNDPGPVAAPGDALVAALSDAVRAHRTRRVPLPVLRAAHARHDPTGALE